MQPCSGIANWMSGSSACNWIASPDQPIAATTSPRAMSLMYELPVTPMI